MILCACGKPAVSPYTGEEQPWCHECWLKFALEERRKFWEETDYGRNRAQEGARKGEPTM